MSPQTLDMARAQVGGRPSLADQLAKARGKLQSFINQRDKMAEKGVELDYHEHVRSQNLPRLNKMLINRCTKPGAQQNLLKAMIFDKFG